MIKLMYWSKKQDKLLVIMFCEYGNLLWYLDQYKDDIDIKNHFIKIVLEEIK